MYEHITSGKKFKFKREWSSYHLEKEYNLIEKDTYTVWIDGVSKIGKVEIKGQTYLEFTLVFFGKELKRSCTIKDFIKSE